MFETDTGGSAYLEYDEGAKRYGTTWHEWESAPIYDTGATYYGADNFLPKTLFVNSSWADEIAIKGTDGKWYKAKTTESDGTEYGYGEHWHSDATKKQGGFADEQQYASGTLNAPGGVSLINEEGVEGIVTPQGTITALPSHTGIVPADLTASLYDLGMVAPNLIRTLESASFANGSSSGLGGEDNSIHIENLYASFEANENFDFDALIREARSVANITRHSY